MSLELYNYHKLVTSIPKIGDVFGLTGLVHPSGMHTGLGRIILPPCLAPEQGDNGQRLTEGATWPAKQRTTPRCMPHAWAHATILRPVRDRIPAQMGYASASNA